MPQVPVTVKVAFALLAVGLLIFIIGFSSPYWVYREINIQPTRYMQRYIQGDINYGLWTYCRDTVEYEYFSATQNRRLGTMEVNDCWSLLEHDILMEAPDETRAAQFFETIGFLAVIVSIFLLVLSMCIDSCKERRILPVLSAVLCLAAAGSIIIGTIIYGAAESHKHDLSWAFALAIIGGIIFGVAGVLIIIGAILKK